MRSKKLLFLLTLVTTASLVFSGCGIFRSEKTEDVDRLSTCDSTKLASGMYYIWHDEEQINLENDIGVDTSKFKDYDYDIFQPVYQEHNLNDSLSIGDSHRICMILAENDDKIPTFYEGDELIFCSEDTLPNKFIIERFYDHGYSFGIFGLSEYVKGSQNYAINTNNSDKVGYKVGSSAEVLATAIGKENTIISIPYVGEKKLSASDISTAGTIKGLLLNSQYDVDIYIGTTRYTKTLTVDTRIFSSYEEEMRAVNYSFVGANLVKIQLPDYLKTGYYNINGTGLFRYIAKGDEYNSKTNFNDPIIEKDDDGNIIYNPIPTDDAEKSTNTNDDVINDSNTITSIKKSVNINENDKINLTVTFSGGESSEVKIKYYIKENDEEASLEAGTKGNPYVYKASSDEIKSGVLTKVFSNLQEGTWIFEIYGLEDYLTHSESIVVVPTETLENNESE